jgi:phenylacetate-CoA ligase
MERLVWDDREYLEGEGLERLRLDKLRRQMSYCRDASPLYRRKMDAIGLEPEDVKTWEDFRRIPPLLTKYDEAESRARTREELGHPFGETLCCPIEDVVVTSASSGTSGTPSFYTFTKLDYEQFLDICARYLWRAGVRKGDSVLHASGLSMWTAHLHHSAPSHVGANSLPVGAEAGSDRMLQYADILRPQVYFGTPSLASYLIDRAPASIGKTVGELGFRIMILGAEPGVGLPAVRKQLADAYGAKLFDLIGPSSPFSYLSCDSPDYMGMHELAPDFNIWPDDLVDIDTHKPIEVTDGAIGVGLMTDLERQAGPVFKYWYGDVLQVFTDPCTCGLPGKRIKILGRADDMLIVKGVNVFPAAVKNLVAAFAPEVTGEIRIVLDEPPPRIVPPLKVRIEHGEAVGADRFPSLAQEIVAKLSSSIRISPEIEFVAPGTLERGMKTALLEHRYRG